MATRPTPTTNSRETLYAILISGVISLILASLMVGNPFHAFVAGYSDYSRENTAGVPPASTTRAPANDAAPTAPAQK